MTKYSVAMICVTLPFAVARAEETAKVFPATSLRMMDIQSAGGDLRIEGSDTQEVKVTVTNQDPAKCEITMEQNGSTLRIKAKGKQKFFWRSGCNAGFQVQSPKTLSLEASSGSGKIRVTELNGVLSLNTGSGDIQMYDVTGDMKARLGSGSLKGTSRAKQAEIRCGSGSVNLEGLLGSANVKAGSGDVNLEWAEGPKAGEVDVKTGSGDVSLMFPEETKLQTDIRTGSGKVRNEIGETASAKLRISVKAGSGDVTIGKKEKQSQG